MADWGLPEDRQRLYESELSDGGILMGVRTRNAEDAGAIARRWTELGAEHLHH
jgi:hypothetical protein